MSIRTDNWMSSSDVECDEDDDVPDVTDEEVKKPKKDDSDSDNDNDDLPP